MFKEPTVRHTQALWREKYQQTLRISDALALAVALALSQLIRFGLGDGFLPLESIPVPYWLVGVILGLAW